MMNPVFNMIFKTVEFHLSQLVLFLNTSPILEKK